jgi:phage baseplate assembly protein W
MPVSRVDRYFKDISLSFQTNPISYDIAILKNENAIAKSIRNIVLTANGEKFFNQNYGGEIQNSLFESFDNVSSSIIEEKVRTAIENYESRVRIVSLDIIPNEEYYQYDVSIVYEIIGIEASPQQLSFALLPTR